ncbi:BTAD domain-containing putative transcriptional regulator [Brevundimonas sp.]|uniref:BTAD domain-containing putative transcriptional regulator n=1 Tax=Brevundimonas sp. TaxID=1871086 RepID=UPI0026223C73|nr:BTAD domain-containing putative transcriptional regulator [Brevundimonas sp.]
MAAETDPERLQLRLFGPLQICRGGIDLPIPASRKTRAILGYLALTGRPVARQRLCELFFEQPDVPRAALRWSLTKLRPLTDTPDRRRLVADRDTVRLDLDGADIDYAYVFEMVGKDAGSITTAERSEALRLMDGELLGDAELPDRPEYTAWLAAQREDFRNLALSLSRQQVDASEGSMRVAHLHRLVALDPMDEAACAALVRALVEIGRKDEAQQFVSQTERQMRLAGLKTEPQLRLALRDGKVPKPSRPAAKVAGPEGLPVVAILPFQDLSAEALPGHIPAGFLDGLTHALSRFRSIVVINAASTASYAGRLEDPVTTAAALGATVLVGGSLSLAIDGRLRLRWRAVDGESGRMLALGQSEGILSELWDLQETAAADIAVQVEPQAQIEALRLRKARPTASGDAYELYLRGLFAGFSLEGRDYELALTLFEQALSIDPRFHPALAMAPWAAAYGNAIKTPGDLQRFAQMSRDALIHGRDDARTQATAGTALFYMAHEFEVARKSIERAIALNPNEYTAWICGGWMHAMKAEASLAHAMFDKAERLNPLAYGANGLMSGRAMAEFMARRMEDGERFIELALAGDDSHPSALMTGIATASALGRRQALVSRREAFLRIYPEGLDSFALQALPFEDLACRTRYFEAVAAGLEAAIPY